MSLTKIGSIGINTGIAFAGVTTIVTLNTANDALSIGATVNVGSGITLGASGDIFATGVSTVTTLKVGSGVTVSSDGDVFATGVTTSTTFSGAFSGSGANVTALNASNISSGTVPTARLGSGTASSSTFLRGDSTFQTVDTDLVSDTSPQLGGNLDVNTKNIVFGDSGGATDDRLTFGAGTDLSIYHNGSDSYIEDSGTGALVVKTSQLSIRNAADDEQLAKFIQDSAVELYHNNTKRLETTSGGVEVFGELQMDDGNSHIKLIDGARIDIGTGADLRIYHSSTQNFIRGAATASPLYIDCCENVHIRHLDTDGSNAETMIKAVGDGAVELYHNNVKKFETHDVGTIFTEAGSGTTQAAIKVNTTYDLYGSIIVRDKTDVHSSISAFQVENASNGANETNLLLRSVNLGSTEYSHGIYAARSHRFAVSNNTTPMVQVDLDGLKFNNDQASANALDDYEEGTFTPRLGPHQSMNTIHENGIGRYTKVGNMVTCTMHWVAKNGTAFGTTDTIRIDSLPYTIKHVGDATSGHYVAMSQMMYNIQFGQQDKHYFYSTHNTTYITGLKSRDGTTWQDWIVSDWNQSNIYFMTAITYMTTS